MLPTTEFDNLSVIRSDVINIMPNRCYNLIITFEGGACAEDITPTITLPQKKGYMMLNKKKYPFMLSTCNNATHQVSRIEVLSELGCIDVSYHCKTRDYRDVMFWGSSKVLRHLGMKKQVLSPRKTRYYCTDIDGSRFDCYIFSVEWKLIDPER